jgi:hypothetical protein
MFFREESDLPTIIRLVFADYAKGDTASSYVRPEPPLSENAGLSKKFIPHTSNEDSPTAALLSKY